jgi:hypothetical protein
MLKRVRILKAKRLLALGLRVMESEKGITPVALLPLIRNSSGFDRGSEPMTSFEKTLVFGGR